MVIQPNKFEQIESVFHEACELEPQERAAYLDEACHDDLELRAEVESLLAHTDGDSQKMSFRESASDHKTLIERGPVAEGPGARIGPYKILQKIGEGGFGVVYMAEQLEPVRRKVALKIIKLGMDTKQVIARFEAERQALAQMDHPNISKVLDAGATETGRPYFVMELVKGISLAEYCDRGKLSLRERLELFLQVCYAIQHAHQKGIIHRDLKPSNVLVTLHDTRAVPVVIDFGIAKAISRQLTEKTLFTEFGSFIGTPEYMSPDQAEISGLDVDTRSDIFSLGVILYELLTGTTPFDAETLRKATYGEIQRIIREDEPPKPSTRLQTLMSGESGQSIAHSRREAPGGISRQLRGDLDWIVMKAMEKDRTRRYQTAREFGADVERFLKREPVLAGPPSVTYKLRKFVQRHRLGVTAGLLITLAILLGVSTAIVGLVQARREALRSQQIADFLQSLFISTNPQDALASDVDVVQVLMTAREVFGGDHATVAAVLRSRAVQLQSGGDFEAAEKMYKESLQIWRARFGDDDINVGRVLGSLGGLQMIKGDEEGAEAALRESLRITSEYPETASLVKCDTLMVLAAVLSNRGEFEEAGALIMESIRIREKYAPHQKLQIALGHIMLGNTYSLGGLLDETMARAPAAIEAWREAVTPDSPMLIRVLMDYGTAYFALDDPDSAEPLLLEVVSILTRSDPQSPYLARSGQLLFRIYEAREDYIAGLEIVLKVAELVRGNEGESGIEGIDSRLAKSAWTLAVDATRTDQEYQMALRAIEFALEVMPDDASRLNTRGVLEYRLGRFETALQTLTLSNTYYRESGEEERPADLAFIAMAHFRLGDEDAAREALASLRTSMQNPKYSLEKNNKVHLAEAEALIGMATDEIGNVNRPVDDG